MGKEWPAHGHLCKQSPTQYHRKRGKVPNSRGKKGGNNAFGAQIALEESRLNLSYWMCSGVTTSRLDKHATYLLPPTTKPSFKSIFQTILSVLFVCWWGDFRSYIVVHIDNTYATQQSQNKGGVTINQCPIIAYGLGNRIAVKTLSNSSMKCGF